MQKVFIGEAIKRRRLELKLTQEKLCEGICEPITISRLENGRQSPSRNLVNALLERLDMPSDRYYALVSKDELEIEDLQAKIAYWDIRFEQTQDVQARVEAIKTHEALQRKMKLEDRISQQLILRSLAILGKEDGPFSPEEKQEMLFRAIRLTAPNFDVSHFEDGLYTANEIKIINQLALNYERLGDQSTTIDILHRLRAYMEQHCRCDRASKARQTMVLFNYANNLVSVGEYGRALLVAKKGRDICIECGHYLFFPELLAVMAEAESFLGNAKDSEELYKQAFYMAKAIGHERNAQMIFEQMKRRDE